MNFSNNYYLIKALKSAKESKERKLSILDAFFLLLEGEYLDTLSYKLIDVIRKKYNVELDLNEAYLLTQNKSVPNKLEIDDEIRKDIFNLVYEMCLNKEELGTLKNKDGHGTTNWIKHCIFHAKMSGDLALMLKQDPEEAIVYGLLHDYGRKYSHKFNHVILGFERLSDLGYDREAIACLTHSFIGGERCASNEPPIEEPDELEMFLYNYKFGIYDTIINLADLTATSYGILSPYDRDADIMKRRKEYPEHKRYFLIRYINTMNRVLNMMGAKTPDYQKELDVKDNITLDEVKKIFKETSDYFYKYYKLNSSKEFNIEFKEKEKVY